jgi:N-acetylglucosaminyldiphosphoundecaprenol N-acetyl-beta-D-mannosaminyltransferase
LSLKKIKIESAGGPFLDKEARPISKDDALIEKEVVKAINKFRPHLLFVAFGAPKQEKWAYKWLDKLEVGGVMVVGGAFDFIAGRAKLPPEWMEKAGLEWLWRLLHQPRRLGRIFVATIVFPVRVFWTKLMS